MTRGRHFALTPADEALLRACKDEDRATWIDNDLEVRYLEPWICDTDKAWDAIHRSFNGSILNYDSDTALKGIILGGEALYFETDYIISLKSPDYVSRIASALELLTKDHFRKTYFKIDPEEYGFSVTEDDFEYSWGWLKQLPPFYKLASYNNRSVIFTAAQ